MAAWFLKIIKSLFQSKLVCINNFCFHFLLLVLFKDCRMPYHIMKF